MPRGTDDDPTASPLPPVPGSVTGMSDPAERTVELVKRATRSKNAWANIVYKGAIVDHYSLVLINDRLSDEMRFGRFGRRKEWHAIPAGQSYNTCSAEARAFSEPPVETRDRLEAGDELCLECLGIATGHAGSNEAKRIHIGVVGGQRSSGGRKGGCQCGMVFSSNNGGTDGRKDITRQHQDHLIREFSLDGISDEERDDWWGGGTDADRNPERAAFMQSLHVGQEIGYSHTSWYNLSNGHGSVYPARVLEIGRGDLPILIEYDASRGGEPALRQKRIAHRGIEATEHANRAGEIVPLELRDLCLAKKAERERS